MPAMHSHALVPQLTPYTVPNGTLGAGRPSPICFVADWRYLGPSTAENLQYPGQA